MCGDVWEALGGLRCYETAEHGDGGTAAAACTSGGAAGGRV